MRYYVGGIPFSSELYHHGIKGQKWGVRRFVNPDGTLTPEGERRYGTVENYNKITEEKRQRSNALTEQRRQASITRGRELYNDGYKHTKNVMKTLGKVAVGVAVYGTASKVTRALGMKKTSLILGAGAVASAASAISSGARKAIDYENNARYGTSYRRDKKDRQKVKY